LLINDKYTQHMQKLVVAILATFRINAADYRLTGHGVFLSMAFFLLKELMRSQLFTAEATFQADLITPIAAYQALKPEAPVLLFESMEGSGRSGRFYCNCHGATIAHQAFSWAKQR
jgi:hypothetical protein